MPLFSPGKAFDLLMEKLSRAVDDLKARGLVVTIKLGPPDPPPPDP